MDFILAGWKTVDIATKLNISPQNITDVKKSVIFQDELAMRRSVLDGHVSSQLTTDLSDQEYVSKQLSEGTRLAVDKLLGFVQPDATCSNGVSRQAASDLLDRGGHPKVTKTDNQQNTIFVLNEQDLTRIKETIELDVTSENKIIEKSETVIDANFESDQDS